jgi:hypothetical protein
MAIFSRRTLQRLIGENASFLSKKQTRRHVDGLNRMNKERSLATEWEVLLINALNKLGNVVHEKDFGGSRRGDVYFEAKGNPTERFLADITTISSKPDPYETLWDELMRIVAERGLRPNSFNLRVGVVNEVNHNVGSRVRLKIPGRARFNQLIFNEQFERFLSLVSRNRNDIQSYEINTHEAELTVGYNPAQRFSSSGTYLNVNPDYVQKYPVTHNRLYSALERKAHQLKGTNFNGPLGIIVCDSDNSLLSKVSSAGLSRTTDEIVYSFLTEEQAISFVILVGVHHRWADYIDIPHWARDQERYEVAFYLFKGKNFDTARYVQGIVQLLPRVLPKPVQSPVNAINWLKGRWPSEGMSFQGGYEMALGSKVNSIKISSRALLDLLSGKVSQQEFLQLHDFTRPGLPEHTTRNPFKLALGNFQLFSKVSLEKSDSKDDDWITFEFGEADPAIGPFREPTSKVNSST